MRAVIEIAKLTVKEIIRKKDFYVALMITAIILFYAAQLKFYGTGNASRYLLDIGLGLSFVFAVILTTALSARQYPQELRSKTGHVLWAKPVSRLQFVLGKFAGSYAAGLVCFTAFFGIMFVFAESKTSVDVLTAFQTYYLFGLGLMIIAALATFFSYFVSTTIAVSLTLLLYGVISVYAFQVRLLMEEWPAAVRLPVEAVYYAVPHFEFFDIRRRFVHGMGAVEPVLMVFLTVYAVVYAGLFLWAAHLGFKRRSIS